MTEHIEEPRDPAEQPAVQEPAVAESASEDQVLLLDEIESSRSSISQESQKPDPEADRWSDTEAIPSSNDNDNDNNDAAAPPSQLQQLMLQRIESINAIRTLVQTDLEQDTALIVHLTHTVEALQSEVRSKESQIEQLLVTNTRIQDELADLTSANTNLQQRNTQMEQTVSTLTSSLKDAKRTLEKEFKYTAALEKEKANSTQHAASAAQAHMREINAYKKRLEEEHGAQTRLRCEMDELRSRLCEEQLKNAKLTCVENNFKLAQESIAKWNAEKAGLHEAIGKLESEKKKMAEKVTTMGQEEVGGMWIEALQEKFGDESEEIVKVLKGATQMERKSVVAE